MSELPQRDPLAAQRRRLFRSVAIELYERPINVSAPDLLPRWRSAPVWLAGVLLLAAASAYFLI